MRKTDNRMGLPGRTAEKQPDPQSTPGLIGACSPMGRVWARTHGAVGISFMESVAQRLIDRPSRLYVVESFFQRCSGSVGRAFQESHIQGVDMSVLTYTRNIFSTSGIPVTMAFVLQLLRCQ